MDSDLLVVSFVPPLQYGKHGGKWWIDDTDYADRLIESTISQNGSVGEDPKVRLPLLIFWNLTMRGKGF